jgi:hypothetical protein
MLIMTEQEVKSSLRDLYLASDKVRISLIQQFRRTRSFISAKVLLTVAVDPYPHYVFSRKGGRDLSELAARALLQICPVLPDAVLDRLRRAPSERVRRVAEEMSRPRDSAAHIGGKEPWIEELRIYVPQANSPILRGDEFLGITVRPKDGQIMWPTRCPCCGIPANANIKVAGRLFKDISTDFWKNETTTTYDVTTWNVPYCSTCVAHARAPRRDAARGWIMLLAILGFYALWAAVILFLQRMNVAPGRVPGSLFLFAMIVTIAILVFLVRKTLRRRKSRVLEKLRAMITPDCWTEGYAIFCRGCETFLFKSLNSLRAVAALNETSDGPVVLRQ